MPPEDLLSVFRDPRLFGLFTRHARAVNSSLAFASTMFACERFRGGGPPVVVLKGEIRRLIGPIRGTHPTLRSAVLLFTR